MLSLVTITRLAEPKSSKEAPSKLLPISSEITCPLVRIAMSCNIALRRSPKPGALTAHTFTIPRMLLTTSVANASPSTSSAMISNGRPDLATPSKSVNISRILAIFLSANKI